MSITNNLTIRLRTLLIVVAAGALVATAGCNGSHGASEAEAKASIGPIPAGGPPGPPQGVGYAPKAAPPSAPSRG